MYNFNLIYELKKMKLLSVGLESPLLRNFFYKIDYANSLEEIKNSLKKDYDLVIVDIDKIPIHLIKLLKSKFVVIAIANFYPKHILKLLNQYGVNGYIVKPLNTTNFLNTINSIFSLKIQLEEEINILKQYKEIVDEDLIVSKADINGKITYVNKAFEEISGYSKEELINKPHSIVRHPDMKDEVFKDLWNTILNKKVWRGIIKNRKKNFESYYVDSIIKPILDRDGNIKEFIALRKEITNFISAEKLINDKLNLTQKALLIFVLIANYKDVRVIFDEEMLETLKKRVTKRVKNLLKKQLKIKENEIECYNVKENIIGFLIDKDIEVNEKIMEVIIKKTNSKPLIVKGFEYYPYIKISYGVGKEHLFEDVLTGIEEIEKEKKVIFSNNLFIKKREEAIENMKMLKIIQEALQKNNIISLYQPIVDNKTKKIVKYESLVRIKKDDKLISPFFFLDIAKKAGLYTKITQKVLRNAFEVIKKSIPVTLNLSPSDILRESIRENIFIMLEYFHPQKGLITFELLEDEIIEYPNILNDFIKEVKKYNVEIAIDDFGSGYSNFSRVVDIQADIIKIDGSLIKGIDKDKTKENIVKSIVNFAKSENKKCVAEFVENEEIYKKLLEIGVDYSQGYYFSKPLEVEQIL